MSFSRVVLVVVAITFAATLQADTIDGRVVQITLPSEDYSVIYTETKGGMSFELRGKTSSIQGQRLYVGNGTIAVLLEAHPSDGVIFQGQIDANGLKFTKGSVIQVKPGFKKATELQPGDIYVTLLNIDFQISKK